MLGTRRAMGGDGFLHFVVCLEKKKTLLLLFRQAGSPSSEFLAALLYDKRTDDKCFSKRSENTKQPGKALVLNLWWLWEGSLSWTQAVEFCSAGREDGWETLALCANSPLAKLFQVNLLLLSLPGHFLASRKRGDVRVWLSHSSSSHMRLALGRRVSALNFPTPQHKGQPHHCAPSLRVLTSRALVSKDKVKW